MLVYASHDASNQSQTHSEASPLIQCIKSDASLDADADAPLDARCGYSLRGKQMAPNPQ